MSYFKQKQQPNFCHSGSCPFFSFLKVLQDCYFESLCAHLMNKSFQAAICMKRKTTKLKESIVPYLAWERPTPLQVALVKPSFKA